MIVAFRRHMLLPLDDCLYALQPSIPRLTRSALHRCPQRHRISRLPDVEDDEPKQQRFKRYPIGYFHINIAEVQAVEGKLFLFMGTDRTAAFAVSQFVEKTDCKIAWEFLGHLLMSVPYRIHTILTDSGIQLAEQPCNRNTASSQQMRFDMICEANEIEHRLTKPNHPWSSEDQKTVRETIFPRDGQVERMNRTIKEGKTQGDPRDRRRLNVKRYHYDSHDQLRTHLADFILRRGRQSTGPSPYSSSPTTLPAGSKPSAGSRPNEYICKIWTSEPDRFIIDPIYQMPGLNT